MGFIRRKLWGLKEKRINATAEKARTTVPKEPVFEYHLPPLSILTNTYQETLTGDETNSTAEELPQLSELSGHEFEVFIEQLIQEMGLSTIRRRQTSDGGIDIEVESLSPITGGRFLIQCKNWQNPVGVGILRDLYGNVISEGVNKGIIITTSDFTKEAKQFSSGKPIELIDGLTLNQLLLHKQETKSPLVQQSRWTLMDLLCDVQFGANQVPLVLGSSADAPLIGDLRMDTPLLMADDSGNAARAIVTSVLFKGTPEDFGFIIIDLKRVDFAAFRNLPHLLYPIIESSIQFSAVLKVLLGVMEENLARFSAVGARDLETHNSKAEKSNKGGYIPYTIVILNGFSVLMETKEIRQALLRFFWMGKTAGMFFIINSDVIRPQMLGKRVTDIFPSILLDHLHVRSSSLLGIQKPPHLKDSEMLLVQPQKGEVIKVARPVLSENSIENVVQFWREQGREAAILKWPIPLGETGEGGEDDFDDALYQKALRIVLQAGEGSASMLQRKLRIGYACAGRMIDLMERQGILGPAIGSKPRPLLRSPEQSPIKFQ